MSDVAWIDAALTSARPQALGALLRYFRNLDTAEEAFQTAIGIARESATMSTTYVPISSGRLAA